VTEKNVGIHRGEIITITGNSRQPQIPRHGSHAQIPRDIHIAGQVRESIRIMRF